MANDIFISYRRSDGIAVDRIYAGLVTTGGFGRSQIFRDQTSLAAGQQWIRQIEDAVARAGAVLAIIGPGWNPTAADTDWVTRELRTALASTPPVPVIPVLLEGADIPAQHTLPAGLEHFTEVEAVSVAAEPTDADIFSVAAALRRNGVSPVRPTDPWEHASKFLPINRYISSLWHQLGDTGEGPSVVLLTGEPGSGRSTVLRRLGPDPTRQTIVGLHAALHVASSNACPAIDEWISGIFEQARASSADLVKRVGEQLVGSELVQTIGHLLPLGSIAPLLPLDQRFGLLRDDGTTASLQSESRRRKLPMPLVIDLLGELASAAANTGWRLILAVDDFDHADHKSRDVVRELVRSRHCNGPARCIQLILSTVDPDLTTTFLGVESTAVATVRLEPDLKDFVEKCLNPLGVPSESDKDELADHLDRSCRSPFEVETLLRHLYRVGSIARSRRERWAFCKSTSPDLPTMREAIDATIDQVMLAPMRQLLEAGALVGMSFAADLADLASKAVAESRASDPSQLTLWHQIRDIDPDERIVRCREASGRRMITLTSSVWWSHLRERNDRENEQQQTLQLGQRYADAAGDQYSDWISAATLLERVGEDGGAAGAYLKAARLARDGMSIDVAARRYRDAAGCMSLVAAGRDRAERAGALLIVAFALVQAARLRCRSAGIRGKWLDLSDDPALPHNGHNGTPPRPVGAPDEDNRKLAASELDLARHALEGLRHALADWPRESPTTEIESLVLDLSDRYLSDHDRITARYHSLAAHLSILQAPTLTEASTGNARSLLENAEQHYSSAVRDAEQGLAGAVRRFLVVLASVGLTEVLTAKAEKCAAEQRPDPSPLTNVVAAALFHACRALLMLRRWPDPPADRLRALELQEADSRVRGCLKRLALALSTDPKLQLEPSINGHPAPLSEVVTSWSRALSPDAWQHAERVSRHASRMATRLCSDEGSQVLDEDIGLVSHAHDLFGRVEPSRVLALFRELETSTLPDPVDRREWISCAEWTTPILLHGRLAALFLDLVLNARSRLGVDRFEQIEQALGSHTTGQKDPPALARLLFVSDTLELLGKAKREGRHLGHSLEDVERAATNDSSLRDAYRLCVQARVEVLDSTGKTPATDTLLAWSNFKCEYSVP